MNENTGWPSKILSVCCDAKVRSAWKWTGGGYGSSLKVWYICEKCENRCGIYYGPFGKPRSKPEKRQPELVVNHQQVTILSLNPFIKEWLKKNLGLDRIVVIDE